MIDDDSAALFARLLCDIMIPAQLSEAIRLQGYDVLEARVLPVETQQDDWQSWPKLRGSGALSPLATTTIRLATSA